MPTTTPWGSSQYSERHFKGCTTYATASHGGIHISPSAYKYLSEYTRKAGWEYGGLKGLWYEEDCAVMLPLYDLFKVPELAEKLKERYKRPTLEQVKQWFPDYEDTQSS